MKKFNRNKEPNRASFYLSPEKKRLIFSIAFNAVLLSVIYFGVCYGFENAEFDNYRQTILIIQFVITGLFWVAFATMLIIYVVYNRAFSRKNVTVDMLPSSWTKEAKEEYVEDGKRRLKKSKWMLAVIIPLMVPIALDALLIYTLPLIQGLFGITTN